MFREDPDSSETSAGALFNNLERLVARQPSTVLRNDTPGYKSQRRVVTFRHSVLRSSNLHTRTSFERPTTIIQGFIWIIQFFKAEDSDARRETPAQLRSPHVMSVYRAVRDVMEQNAVWPGIGHGKCRQPLPANSTLEWLVFPYSRLGPVVTNTKIAS